MYDIAFFYQAADIIKIIEPGKNDGNGAQTQNVTQHEDKAGFPVPAEERHKKAEQQHGERIAEAYCLHVFGLGIIEGYFRFGHVYLLAGLL